MFDAGDTNDEGPNHVLSEPTDSHTVRHGRRFDHTAPNPAAESAKSFAGILGSVQNRSE